MFPELAFRIGSFPVYTFGVFLAAAYLLGAFLFWRAGRSQGFSSDDLFDLLFLTSAAALAAGRILFLAFAGKLADPSAFIRFGEGLFWAGAFPAGLAAVYFYTRAKRWSFLRIADLIVVPLAVAASAVAIPSALYVSLGYFILAGLLWLLGPRLPLGATFFAYLFFSGPLVYLMDINFLFGQLLFMIGAVGLVALWLRFRVKINQ